MSRFEVRPIRRIRYALRMAVGGGVAFAALLLCMNPCRGDLYGETVLSLEWQVDSSDVICHVSVPRDKSVGTISIKEILKSNIEESELLEAASHWGRVGPPPEPIEEWLFFVRKRSTGKQYIFGSINLTRPLESPRYAAITKKGVPLPDRRTILRAVKTRIEEELPLPPGCDRDLVDAHSTVWAGNYRPMSKAQAEREWLQMRVGGFVHPEIEVGYWNDRNGPYNQDTLVSIVVPAEPEYKGMLLRKLSSNKQFHDNEHLDRMISERFILPLVNYSEDDTLKVLREFRGGNDDRVQKVLRFLKDLDPP